MRGETTRLKDACKNNLLHTKWLLAPSHRVGQQWIETLVRNGQPAVNLHPTTVLRLALDLVGSDLARDGLTLAGRSVGSLVVEAIWHRLSPDGYLGRLKPSPELSAAVCEALLSLKLAGACSNDLDELHLESAAKARDILVLLNAYEEFFKTHAIVDEADAISRAIAKLTATPGVVEDQARFLVPSDFHAAGLERQFLDALPGPQRIEIQHPADRTISTDSATDIRLLASVEKTAEKIQSKKDGSVKLYRAVGEINEVREALRRCLADRHPVDEVEILHTDAATYVPLIYATARRYFSEPDRPEGVPVTFAEGIPANLSRPGRALAAWLRWIQEDYPQRVLVEMIGDGLLDCGDDDLSFSSVVRLLRPIAIGFGADKYLPKLDEQIKAVGKAPPNALPDGDDDSAATAARERKRKGLKSLRKLTKQLLSLSQDMVAGPGSTRLEAAEKFLKTSARSVSELDQYAADALIEKLQERRRWLDRLDVPIDLGKWLVALPAQTTFLGSGPRPGHLHVAHIGSGGPSGRTRTFVMGLDDRRFPGAALQDPILLDRERASLSPELSTSAVRTRHKIDELIAMLSRLSGSVTLSWPCHDLTDDRETFPCSLVLSVYRLMSDRQDADLESLNAATAPPVSFAPTAADKALDETERWLWRLSDETIQGASQVSLVETHYPHLARGSAAQRQRSAGFGPFNGHVPQAGADLNPFSADGPVLSASGLETIGRCPLAFFFRNGLEIRLPDALEIDPDRWIDAAQFGSLMHDVFRRFMDELTSAGQRPQFERDHHRLAQILHEVVEQWRQDVPPPNEHAYRMQYWQLVRTSRIFLQEEEEFCQASQPRFFEAAVGLDSVAGGSPLDDKEPATVSLPNGELIRARGRIDRVDETDVSRYSVWDYKLGSGYGYDQKDPFRQGRRVQSVLYLRMIEAALRKRLDPQAIVERFGYFLPGIRAHGRRVDWDAGALAAGMAILTRLCASVENGAFVATNEKDDCRHCEYASICRDVNRVTSQSQGLLDRDDLVPLAHFRELRRG